MSKISRADSKARFRTGMYPTQADFENLHDSYVHKDDTIPLEQVGTNGATVVSLLNQKANSSHTHEIADVNGLQTFINKVNTFLDTVDASDDTINRWKEIESFLQGITDTETLTGLLANLRTEIVALIPAADNKAYLQLVSDLDAYTDAPVGTIVKYTGQTNDKYTHGFDYERVAGDAVVIPAGTVFIQDFSNCTRYRATEDEILAHIAELGGAPFSYIGPSTLHCYRNGSLYAMLLDGDTPSVGERVVFLTTGAVVEITEVIGSTFKANGDTFTPEDYPMNEFVNVAGEHLFVNANISSIAPSSKTNVDYECTNTTCVLGNDKFVFNATVRIVKSTEDTVIGSPSSWRPCKSQSVID